MIQPAIAFAIAVVGVFSSLMKTTEDVQVSNKNVRRITPIGKLSTAVIIALFVVNAVLAWREEQSAGRKRACTQVLIHCVSTIRDSWIAQHDIVSEQHGPPEHAGFESDLRTTERTAWQTAVFQHMSLCEISIHNLAEEFSKAGIELSTPPPTALGILEFRTRLINGPFSTDYSIEFFENWSEKLKTLAMETIELI